MPKLSRTSQPAYRKHKATGQAVVTINGKDHYLGPHGTKASHKEYDRLIAEWIANGRTSPAAANETTVVEPLAAYLRHAKVYYRDSDERDQIIYAARPLKELYGKTTVAEFSPLKLKAVRQKMIEADLCRIEINKRIGRLKRMFRWRVETSWFRSPCCMLLKPWQDWPAAAPRLASPIPSSPCPRRSSMRSSRSSRRRFGR